MKIITDQEKTALDQIKAVLDQNKCELTCDVTFPEDLKNKKELELALSVLQRAGMRIEVVVKQINN